MSTATDLTTKIIDDLKSQSYFDLADNGAKTRIRNALAQKHNVAAVWIKDVVVNGYGKKGRRIEDSKVVDLFDSSQNITNIKKISEDPAEGYVSFTGARDAVYFASAAPAQVGTGIMKALAAIKKGSPNGLVIINNGNDGPLSDKDFKDFKATLDKLNILASAVHSEGISHKVQFLKLMNRSTTSKLIQISNICIPLLTKPFLILTGPSGTGKTREASKLARRVCGEDAHALVAVGADWTDNRHVLGYLNPLETVEADGEPLPIYETTAILDLILHANEHKDEPHVLILDEMNLSHVERYFADFLSAMELEDKENALKLHTATKALTRTGKDVPRNIDFPSNLFVIGTVNIDETTYMFSPKVLDRANVIEIHAGQKAMKDFLNESDVEGASEEAKDYGISFLDAARAIQNDDEDALPPLPDGVRDEAAEHLMALFRIMERGRSEFGFRTGKEVKAYLRVAHFLAGTDDAARAAWVTEKKWLEALDAQILQKILPKLHGSRSRLAPLLGALATYCGSDEEATAMEHFAADGVAAKRVLNMARGIPDPTFKKSYQKLERMIEVLIEEQFVSFIC